MGLFLEMFGDRYVQGGVLENGTDREKSGVGSQA